MVLHSRRPFIVRVLTCYPGLHALCMRDEYQQNKITPKLVRGRLTKRTSIRLTTSYSSISTSIPPLPYPPPFVNPVVIVSWSCFFFQYLVLSCNFACAGTHLIETNFSCLFLVTSLTSRDIREPLDEVVQRSEDVGGLGDQTVECLIGGVGGRWVDRTCMSWSLKCREMASTRGGRV